MSKHQPSKHPKKVKHKVPTLALPPEQAHPVDADVPTPDVPVSLPVLREWKCIELDVSPVPLLMLAPVPPPSLVPVPQDQSPIDLTKKYRTMEGFRVSGLHEPEALQGSRYPLQGCVHGHTEGAYLLSWTRYGAYHAGYGITDKFDLIEVEE